MAKVHMFDILFLTLFSTSLLHQSYCAGPACLSCRHVTRVEDCRHVEVCQDHQLCGIETLDSELYNLGCLDAQVCSSVRSAPACVTCCHGNLCNTKGCEIIGFPVPRGPICYDCSGMDGPSSCRQIRKCPSLNYECMLVRNTRNGSIKYDTACFPKTLCPGPSSIFGRRQIRAQVGSEGRQDSCRRCCGTDLCNDEDCSPSTGPPMTSSTASSHVPTDGNWGPWSPWTPCLATCGKVGVRHRFRHCDSPAPQFGGLECIGLKFGTVYCYPTPCCTAPPRIYYISPDIAVRMGDHVILQCNVTGADKITWEGSKIVGHVFPKNVEVIQGRDDLLISGVTSENLGLYHCVAANACGSTSRTVAVNSLR